MRRLFLNGLKFPEIQGFFSPVGCVFDQICRIFSDCSWCCSDAVMILPVLASAGARQEDGGEREHWGPLSLSRPSQLQ